VREALVVAQQALRRTGAGAAWMPPANFHVSLAFLGNIPRSLVPEVAAVLDTLCAGRRPFAMEVRGLGTFGPPNRPRVVWAGTRGDEPLASLHGDLREWLALLNLEIDPRPFRGHVTLARVKPVQNLERLLAALGREDGTSFGEVPVNEVALMQSVLVPAGAVYTRLHAAQFAAA
jgi:2'-5' RNA ligase